MKTTSTNFLLIFLLSFFSGAALAQRDRCATMEVLQEKISHDPSLVQRMEKQREFTKEYVARKKSNKGPQMVITIPVVVHVVNMGEPVGTGSNISDAQVISQFGELNEDFRNMNHDTLPQSHPFGPATADCEIEFCLATRDPSGNATTGIERMDYGVATTIWDFESFIKPQSIWDPDKYLNIWVTEFDSALEGHLLGYAQFPGGDPTTDGVVIRYYSFGRTGNVIYPVNLGRIAPHEIGHWLGLRHIWGDAFCGDDFIADTEPAEQANVGCFIFPYHAFNACGTGPNGEMFMNYMDYSYDSCIVMFTQGQKDVMRATLFSDRLPLQSSDGCFTVGVPGTQSPKYITISPNPVTNELRIKNAGLRIEKIEVYDVLGQKHNSAFYILNSELRVDVSQLGAGVYFVKVKGGNEVRIAKVVKE